MLKIPVAIGLGSLIALTALGEPEIKGTATELNQYLKGIPKTTFLSGEAELRVPAQRAVVTMKVVTEHKSFQEALRLNLDLRTRVAEALKKQGILAERIQASKFSSTPKFGLFGEKAKSYRIENLVRVTVQDEKELQAAAGAVDAWSEVQFIGVEFEYTDKAALKEKAIAQACDNVLQRKKAYEEKLGVELTPVSFNPGEVNALNVAPNLGDSAGRGYLLSSGIKSAGAPVEAIAEESVTSLGELLYTARVTVEYAVRPK